MNIAAKMLLGALAAGLSFGCASAPPVQYAVEAERVTAQALEPVLLESARLEDEVHTRFAGKLPSADAAEGLMRVIQTEIANTRRFTKVLLNASEGDCYIVQPSIDSIDALTREIANDPTRKKVQVRARVRLDVLFVNQKNQKELVKSFSDERKLEERVPARETVTPEAMQEYVLKTVQVAFRAASDQLGHGFNPSYEMGTVTRIEGKRIYVQINTSKIRKLPKKQQAVDIVDPDNKVLAAVSELVLEDGSLSGKIFEKGGGTVREGMAVRARVNALAN